MQGAIPYPGLGVVFNIEALEEETIKRAAKLRQDPDAQKLLQRYLYGRSAWRIFMKTIHPRQITPSILLDGDTELTLRGFQNEYCIAFYGPNLDLETLRRQILEASDYGFAPFHRRLIEKIALDRQPLATFGRIDGMGRLVTEAWARGDHDLCKESGWPYAPERVPSQLEPRLAAELAAMGWPRIE